MEKPSGKKRRVTFKDTIEINGVRLPLKVYFEDRQNATGSIRSSGIHIRIPAFLDDKARIEQLEKIKKIVIEELSRTPERLRTALPREYTNGETLVVGNAEYKLNISRKFKNSSSARIIGNVIHISVGSTLSPEEQKRHISTLISRCVARKRLPGIKKKIHELNEKHFKLPVNKISFRHSKTRWGSCSTRGNITISTRLLFAPDDVIECVCIHELAHLIEPNHSDKFWALMKKAIPDYKEKNKWLKDNIRKCTF